MPRTKGKAIQWKLTLNELLAARVEHRLANLAEGRPVYGARSALVASLLRDWLNDTYETPKAGDPNLNVKLENLPDDTTSL